MKIVQPSSRHRSWTSSVSCLMLAKQATFVCVCVCVCVCHQVGLMSCIQKDNNSRLNISEFLSINSAKIWLTTKCIFFTTEILTGLLGTNKHNPLTSNLPIIHKRTVNKALYNKLSPLLISATQQETISHNDLHLSPMTSQDTGKQKHALFTKYTSMLQSNSQHCNVV